MGFVAREILSVITQVSQRIFVLVPPLTFTPLAFGYVMVELETTGATLSIAKVVPVETEDNPTPS